jgi:uncharacterized protein DUF4190
VIKPALAPATDRLAIASLFLGVVGLFCCFSAPAAIVLGILSSRRITASGGALRGRGFARAGWILGAVVMVFYVGALLLIALSCSQGSGVCGFVRGG